MTLDEALNRIDASPAGPQVAAFFDFDGTIVHGFSGLHFFRDRLLAGKVGPGELLGTLLNGARGTDSEADFERFVAVAFRAWAGHTEAEMSEVGKNLFEHTLAGLLYPEAWQLIRAHEAKGHTLVIASSASKYQFEAAAEALGVPHLLYTPLEVHDGVLTGQVDGKSLWRSGKARAAREFVAEHGIDAAASFTYSNGGEDEEFLSVVGNPTATNPDKALAAATTTRGWPVLRFRPRGAHSIKDVARTAAAFGTIVGAAGTGLGLGLLNRDRKIGLDAITSLGSETALATAGVDIRVLGEENVWSYRPAVFIFNHQSQLDILVLAKLLREGITGIAKQEIATDPILGLPLQLAGVTFIDRKNSAKARAALAPVVETLRSGTSVIIAPEGTRSLTPSINPFKKGAFHIAMQAGVPVVPVVLRNTGELMWKHSTLVRSGTVDVLVHEPIDVSGWRHDELDSHIAEIETFYRDTIANWPKGGH